LSRSRAELRKGCPHWRSSKPGSRAPLPISTPMAPASSAPMSVPIASPSRARARKPNTVLYERAARRLGARGCLVRTGWAT